MSTFSKGQSTANVQRLEGTLTQKIEVLLRDPDLSRELGGFLLKMVIIHLEVEGKITKVEMEYLVNTYCEVLGQSIRDSSTSPSTPNLVKEN